MIDIGLLAVESSRTRCYLSALDAHGLLPKEVVFFGRSALAGGGSTSRQPLSYFDNVTLARDRIRGWGLPCTDVLDDDVNSPAVIDAVARCRSETFIFSGPGGAIIRRPLFETGKRFLHVHPGLLPDFLGSTTVYYSLLLRGECGASALLLNEHIDAGPIVGMRSYPAPHDRTQIDYGYDPAIRADLLVRTLQAYRESGDFEFLPPSSEAAMTYYIIHPILKHIAILSQRTFPSPREVQDLTW